MDKIEKFLVKICVPTSQKGFDYLHDAIEIYTKQKIPTIEIYTKVAEIHNAKYQNVERCIRHSIKSAFKNSDYETLNSIFGYRYKKSGKLNNSEFISFVALYLKE